MGKDRALNIENRLKDQKERVDIKKTTYKKLRLTNANLWLRINLKRKILRLRKSIGIWSVPLFVVCFSLPGNERLIGLRHPGQTI